MEKSDTEILDYLLKKHHTTKEEVINNMNAGPKEKKEPSKKVICEICTKKVNEDLLEKHNKSVPHLFSYLLKKHETTPDEILLEISPKKKKKVEKPKEPLNKKTKKHHSSDDDD
jgi:hypothetical protein